MFRDNKILAVIPARGGSKGIKKKNIYPLNGRPLIDYTAAFVKSLDWIDRTVVSTDSEEIAEVAEASGLEVPFRRPAELSGDQVSDCAVLEHALHATESDDSQRYNIVILLQPTSPFRRTSYILSAVEMLFEEELDSVWTISPSDSKAHPVVQLVIKEGLLDYYDARGSTIIARQQLDTVYYRNGAAYVLTRDCILLTGNKKGDRTGAVLIEEPIVNIDNIDDIRYAEYLIEKKLVQYD